MPKPDRQEQLRRDAELVRRAEERAGGTTRLAELFGITKGAVSQWATKSPLSPHIRERLRLLVGDTVGPPIPQVPRRLARVQSRIADLWRRVGTGRDWQMLERFLRALEHEDGRV